MRLVINTTNKQFVQGYLADCAATRQPVAIHAMALDDGSSLLFVDNICLLLPAGDSIPNLSTVQDDTQL